MLSPLVTQANGYQNRQISAECFSELASYSLQRAPKSLSSLRFRAQKLLHKLLHLPAALNKLVQAPWAPKTAKWGNQDCRPINESFSHSGILRCQRGTCTHTLVSAQICLNVKPGCFLPITRKILKWSHQLQRRMERKPQTATPILAEQNLSESHLPGKGMCCM